MDKFVLITATSLVQGVVDQKVTLDLSEKSASCRMLSRERPRSDRYAPGLSRSPKIESMPIDPLRLDLKIIIRKNALRFL